MAANPKYKGSREFPLAKVITDLVPGAIFTIQGNTYQDIQWHESNTESLPTEDEILARQSELIDEYDSNIYKTLRAEEYPSIEDQLDDLFHNGFEGWKSSIQTIKNKYPKS